MKTRNYFKTLLLLVVLVVAGSTGIIISCEKPEEPTSEPPQPPDSLVASDVDIQGTWECIRPYMSGDKNIRITFAQQLYYVDGWYPQESMFKPGEVGNYLIRDSLFYMWHTTIWPNHAEIPFQDNIEPMFNVSFHGDTLSLRYKYSLPQDAIYGVLGWWEFVRI